MRSEGKGCNQLISGNQGPRKHRTEGQAPTPVQIVHSRKAIPRPSASAIARRHPRRQQPYAQWDLSNRCAGVSKVMRLAPALCNLWGDMRGILM